MTIVFIYNKTRHLTKDCKKKRSIRKPYKKDWLRQYQWCWSPHQCSFINEFVLCCFLSQPYQQFWAMVNWHWCYKTCMRWEKDVFHLKNMDGEKLYMRNSSTSKVLGGGKVTLKMTSRKLFTLNNVLHVTVIRKN